MLDLVEVVTAEPVEDAAPELRVPSDDVVDERQERAASSVEPPLVGAVAVLLPDRRRVPVLRLLRYDVPALEDQHAGAGRGEGMRHGAAPGAAADDHHVEVLGPRRGRRARHHAPASFVPRPDRPAVVTSSPRAVQYRTGCTDSWLNEP